MVGQRMWQRDWPAVHVALNAEWSEDVSDIMAALKGIYYQSLSILINLIIKLDLLIINSY